MKQTFQQMYNDAEAFFSGGEYDKAFHCYALSLKLAKERLKAQPSVNLMKTVGILYHCMAHANYKNKKYKSALPYYELAINVLEDEAVRYEMALCYLHAGDYENGLKNYRARFFKDTDDAVRFPELPIPFIEDCDELDGKTVLVLNEQGFGDELMFLRYVEDISLKVKNAHVQIYPEMFDLITSNLKFDNITFFCERSFNIEFVEKFDVYTSLGAVWSDMLIRGQSVPLKLDNVVKTFSDDKLRVGIVCSANGKSINAVDRGVDPSIIVKAINDTMGQATIFNLQPDSQVDGAIDCSAVISSFNDTASLIKSMDVVLSIDSAAAHLTMAVGTELILLRRDYIDWRWSTSVHYKYATFATINVNDQLSELSELLINRYLRGSIWNFN